MKTINNIIAECVHNYLTEIVDEKTTLNRILTKHGNEGYIIISANKDYNDAETNQLMHDELERDIKMNGYNSMPSYGGYQNSETGEIGDYEPSFIIFNNGANPDFDKLVAFGIKECGKFDQDCFLVKAPNKPAIYVDRDGNKANSRESSQIFKNDPTQMYYTTLNNREKDLANAKKGITGRRWTHDIEF